jgi:hypothetical protein
MRKIKTVLLYVMLGKLLMTNDEKCRAISGPTADGTATLEGMTILESSDMKADEAESLLKSVNRWLKNQDHSLMKPSNCETDQSRGR